MPKTAPTGSLRIQGLEVAIQGKKIIHEIDLTIPAGEIHAVMGPNGSGKSTLCYALAGDPQYQVKGRAVLDGEDILAMKIEERSRHGLFLAFQHPVSVPGVNVFNYLRTIYNTARKPQAPLSVAEFGKVAGAEVARLGVDPAFLSRYLNDGFSGGEKKRMEVLQMALLEPKYVLLDELDSGLDVDAIERVFDSLRRLQNERRFAVLAITHYARILKYLKPDRVHVLHKGKIIASGGPELAARIEKEGYEKITGEKADEGR